MQETLRYLSLYISFFIYLKYSFKVVSLILYIHSIQRSFPSSYHQLLYVQLCKAIDQEIFEELKSKSFSSFVSFSLSLL